MKLEVNQENFRINSGRLISARLSKIKSAWLKSKTLVTGLGTATATKPAALAAAIPL